MKVFLAIALGVISFNLYAQVFDVPHADEAPTRTFLIQPAKPRALVLLFPGGGGMVGIFDNGSMRSRHTFIRSMGMWEQYNIAAVVVDTPYDLGDLRRGDRRDRQDHLSRVDEVINFYKQKLKLPVWIFGHSMGTSTATHFVNSNKTNALSGIVIAGTVRTASVGNDVTLPVLAIHHLNDQCLGTPLSASEKIISGRPKNTVAQLEIIEGGTSEGGVCESFAYHGFNQTEPEFIQRAAQFILSH